MCSILTVSICQSSRRLPVLTPARAPQLPNACPGEELRWGLRPSPSSSGARLKHQEVPVLTQFLSFHQSFPAWSTEGALARPNESDTWWPEVLAKEDNAATSHMAAGKCHQELLDVACCRLGTPLGDCRWPQPCTPNLFFPNTTGNSFVWTHTSPHAWTG